MRIFTFLTICVCLVKTLCAQTDTELFILGNNAYKSGDMQNAKQYYSESLAKKPSAQTAYNLANTCSKIGKKGEAKLHYLQAMYFDPTLAESAANLQMLAKDDGIEPYTPPFISPLIGDFSVSEWTVAAFISFWTAVIFLFVPPLYGKSGAVTAFVWVLSALICALSLCGVYGWSVFANTAIVAASEAQMKISPTANAPVDFVLNQGQSGKILKRKSGYFYIQTPSGKTGWVNSEQMPAVIPQDD